MYDLKHSNGELWPPGYTEASPYLYENAFGQQYPYNRLVHNFRLCRIMLLVLANVLVNLALFYLTLYRCS